MNKKILSLLLTLCMVFALLPATASAANVAASGTCGENAKWTITDDGVMTISGTGTVTQEFLPVEDYQAQISQVQTVRIEEGITAVGDNALCSMPDCEYLEEALYLPDSLLTIGQAAFANHKNLREIRLGSQLTSIGEMGFMDCSALESVGLPDSLQFLGQNAFSATGLREVAVPGGVRILEPAVFSYCKQLTKVTLCEGVEEIGENEFFDCSALQEIEYGDSLGVIMPGAFTNCTSLEVMYLTNISRIPDSCFSGCTSLELVYLEDVDSIGSRAFLNCSMLDTLYLPDTIEMIDSLAFSGCGALKEIRLPARLRVVPYGLFQNCSSLETVIMPNSVFSIEQNAFSGCNALDAIFYAGTDSQLAQIRVEPTGNSVLQNVDIYLIPTMPDPVFGLFDMPAPGNWAYDGIAFCLYTGLMNGMGNGYFQPNGTTTRAQLVTILWRMMDEPEASKSAPFTDLTQDWYREAVAWAAENGITTGTSATTFDPNAPVTREQMVTIFYRMCRDYLDIDVSPAASLAPFPDNAKASSWAKDALQWGVAVKLINGVGDGSGNVTLQPQGSATRAQIATVMLNFVTAFQDEL